MASIGILDADLLSGKQKRFPNLAAMKLSAWHKQHGDLVSIVPSYSHALDFDRLYICCVFTDSAAIVPPSLLKLPHVRQGGTGFFFDLAKPLPADVEHTKPDYDLYLDWLTVHGRPEDQFYYTSASIGFLTRGCFRHCKFCVLHNSRGVSLASPILEFYDPSKERICMLDDNALGYKARASILGDLIALCKKGGKTWEFKQGVDMRLMRDDVSKLFGQHHHGEVIFAFDNIKDAQSVRKGLSSFRKNLPSKGAKAYVLCGFHGQDELDVATIFRRLEILWSYKCLGYIMRHRNHKRSPLACRDLYTYLAAWCNQPQFQRLVSFRQYCEVAGGKALRVARTFESRHPDVAKRFFGTSYKTVKPAF